VRVHTIVLAAGPLSCLSVAAGRPRLRCLNTEDSGFMAGIAVAAARRVLAMMVWGGWGSLCNAGQLSDVGAICRGPHPTRTAVSGDTDVLCTLRMCRTPLPWVTVKGWRALGLPATPRA
jgi:hypothetical protein